MTAAVRDDTASDRRLSRLRARQDDKYDERRTQLAESALATLGELGYARTSLREIAQNSEFSHGVVHYYFKSKVELIVHCVRHYKAQCVTRYDEVVVSVDVGRRAGSSGFADKLVETLTDEAPMHRLWYDLRTQSMFDDEYRADVLAIDGTLEQMIGRVRHQVRRAAWPAAGRLDSLDSPSSTASPQPLPDGAVREGPAPRRALTAASRLPGDLGLGPPGVPTASC